MIAFLLTLLLAMLPHAGHHAHPFDTGGGTPMNGAAGTAQPADTGGGTPMSHG
jgi:hypothetical protein